MAADNQLVISFDKLEDQTVDFETPVQATVYFAGAKTEKFDFKNPIPADDLKELRWYIERSWQYRAKEEDGRIEKIETNLRRFGQELFNGVFEKSARAMGMYERLMERRKEGKDCSVVIDTKEPRILRLPWELLADEGGYLFSKNPPVNIRRRMQKTSETDVRDFSLPVRVLMVVSRPLKAGFIDPRSSAKPLLDALDELGNAAEVEFLRPPTVTALMHRIRDRKQPPIHVVHFDGHGVYDPGVGLGFLLFEKDDYSNDMVDAERLGSLLNECGIPLMILDACQSAEPDDKNPFGSVAARLIESGVGGVVAMNYSVLVETSKRLIGHFYSSVAKGESISAALGTARMELLANTSRHHYFSPREQKEIDVELQDWFVPALYQQADELIPFKPDGNSIAPTRKATIPQQSKSERGGFPPAPLHGFHGRARELLDLERAFATRDIVVLHGFGGQGKTSLATQAAEWFTRTHLFERAAFISFETGASFDFVLNELGNALVEDNFQIHQGDKVEAIAQSLREKPALIVFDNFESALPDGNAPMAELQTLLDAAAQWFTPLNTDHRSLITGSRLLITTRNPSIPHPAFTPSKTCLHKELIGLAASDALELAASILEAYSLPRPPRVPLEELLTFLKGHPLSLQLALPQLRDHSAQQLVAEYQTILPQMKRSEKQERNESLEVSLKFSLDRLGKDAVTLLSRLVIFEDGAWEPLLLNVTEIPEDEWNKLKPQLTSTALVRLEDIPNLKVPFVHFHPTLVPYIRAYLQPDQSLISNLQERYWQVYFGFANELYQTDIQQPYIARALATRELPNLKCALKLTLSAGALDEAVTFATAINKFLDAFGRWRERDEIAKEVERVVNSNQSSVESGKITQREFMLEYGRGQRLLQGGRAGEAEQVFRALLSRLEGEAEYDTRFAQTATLQRLGRCLKSQGRPSQSVDFYHRAIVLAKKLEQTKDILNHVGKIHTDLADVYVSAGMYADAKKEYETSIEFCKQADDDRAVGVNLGQLGTLAMTQGDLNEARKRYLEALSLFQRMGEDQSEAVIWHQLGRVAEEARDWDEADKIYKEAAQIRERIQDLPNLAANYNQLAMVAESAGRPQEAERWYLRAIELFEKVTDTQNLAKGLSNLADLYLAQNRLDEAETYARRALAIMETLDLSAQPWKTYAILAELAEKRGRLDEVRAWRRKEQESRLIFEANSQADTSSPNVREKADQWNDIVAGIIAVCQSGESDSKLDNFLNEMAGKDDWKSLTAVLRRILSGEREMDLFDGLDAVDSAIVRRVLKGVLTEGRMPSAHSSSQSEQQQGVTLPQLLELVERAARGDQQLGGQLFNAFQGMARDPNPAMSTLGNILLRVLVGERNPDLAGLPNELASLIRGMLGRLKNG